MMQLDPDGLATTAIPETQKKRKGNKGNFHSFLIVEVDTHDPDLCTYFTYYTQQDFDRSIPSISKKNYDLK